MRDAISLLSIPNELLEQIFGAVQEQPALAAAARTCRTLRDIAEAHLYSHLILERPESLEYVEELMKARPQRAGFVQRLDLVFGTATYDENLVKMTTADTVAALFPNLKCLVLESPGEQDRRGPNPPPFVTGPPADITLYENIFESVSLLKGPRAEGGLFQNLTCLTLRWSGTSSRMQNITPAYPVFLLPNLEKLEIFSVIVRPIYDELKIQEMLRFAGKTNLKTLIFMDSHVMPKALDLLLKVPKALEYLKLSELLVGGKSEDRSLQLSVNSLRHLALDIWRWEQPWDNEEDTVRPRILVDLAGLPSLQTLQVGPHSDEMQYRWTLVGPVPSNLGFLRLADFEVRALLRPVIDSVLSDLRMGEVLSTQGGKRPSLVVDLSFLRFLLNRDLEVDCKHNVRGLIRDLTHKLRELQRANTGTKDVGLSSSSPPMLGSAPYPGSGEQGGFDLGMTTVKPALLQKLYLYHQKEPQRVVRYRYSHNSTRPDQEEFVTRPYFEKTGLPEDQANLEDQHADAIEWFAFEGLP